MIWGDNLNSWRLNHERETGVWHSLEIRRLSAEWKLILLFSDNCTDAGRSQLDICIPEVEHVLLTPIKR